MLRLVLPKGSLERATFELFEAADLTVNRTSTVDYKATIDDPRIDEVRILRPQEIPRYVAEGLFDLGITGRDWVEETGATVVSLGELAYSKATSNPIRVVVAVAADADVKRVDDLPNGVRVSTEYPELTRRFFESSGGRGRHPAVLRGVGGQDPRHRRLHRRHHRDRAGRCGPPGCASSTRSWSPTPSWSPTRPAAADPAKRHAMGQLLTLLHGALEARGKVLVKLNVADGRPRAGPGPAAVDEVADGVAPGRGRVRGGDGGREAHHQHADPRR